VDNALLMGGFERVSNLARDGQGVGERDRAARDMRRQIVALDELHHQVSTR
jgi:hypothetical protein